MRLPNFPKHLNESNYDEKTKIQLCYKIYFCLHLPCQRNMALPNFIELRTNINQDPPRNRINAFLTCILMAHYRKFRSF